MKRKLEEDTRPTKKQKVLFTCPVTLEVFDNPVTLECGHTFEKNKLLNQTECPTCNRRIRWDVRSLGTNQLLADLMRELLNKDVSYRPGGQEDSDLKTILETLAELGQERIQRNFRNVVIDLGSDLAESNQGVGDLSRKSILVTEGGTDPETRLWNLLDNCGEHVRNQLAEKEKVKIVREGFIDGQNYAIKW